MEMKSKKQWWVSILVCCCLMAIPGLSHASLAVSGTGTGTAGSISATALFDLVTYNFGSGEVDAIKITLTNTSSSTNVRGDLLTGLFWSMSGVGALPTDATGFDGSATVRTSNTTSIANVDIAPAAEKSGLYMLANRGDTAWGKNANDGLNYDAYAYGISTVSMGLPGFNGNKTGGDEYGIAASGATIPKNGGLSTALPIIDGSAIFYIAKPEELTSLSQITNAAFGFGSLPDHRVEAAAVPIPPTVLIFGSGLMGVFGVRRRLGGIS